ncbi:MAG TPA: DUF2066 domain-containing protein [Methylococcaceae bacterium]|nr:DUF2066 domain-containing protein [Methylococcaceae bacterium]
MPGSIARSLLLLFLIGCPSAQAAEIRTLYQAEVTATGNDETARDQDIRRALQLVLGRVISPAALASRASGAILEKAVNYVLSYEYASKPAAENASVKTEVMRVNFDQMRLTEALRQKGVNVWAEQRPTILVWLGVGDDQRQEWFMPEMMPEIDRELRQAAEQEGLPIALPLLDLTDQQSLSVEDLGSGADERIRAASARYEAAGVLAGRLSRSTENGWDVLWRFYRPDAAPANWQGRFNSLAEAMQAGFAGAYGKLAEHYIPKTLSETRVELRVTGITSLADVSTVASYLSSLSLIRTVEWLRIEPTQAVFRLFVRGDRTALEQAFALGKTLRPVEGETQGFTGMNYQLSAQ